jgi:hypothetical protein
VKRYVVKVSVVAWNPIYGRVICLSKSEEEVKNTGVIKARRTGTQVRILGVVTLERRS